MAREILSRYLTFFIFLLQGDWSGIQVFNWYFMLIINIFGTIYWHVVVVEDIIPGLL